MDELERDDLEVARNTSPEERASQLLAVIRTGFRLKRSALRARYPSESEDEIERRFRDWLESDVRRMSAATRDTPSAELADHLLLGRGT